jgi:hypothetical protein
VGERGDGKNSWDRDQPICSISGISGAAGHGAIRSVSMLAHRLALPVTTARLAPAFQGRLSTSCTEAVGTSNFNMVHPQTHRKETYSTTRVCALV